jgi:hypothetical protein
MSDYVSRTRDVMGPGTAGIASGRLLTRAVTSISCGIFEFLNFEFVCCLLQGPLIRIYIYTRFARAR